MVAPSPTSGAAIAPVVADFVGEMPYTEMQAFFDADYPKGTWAYIRAHYLADLTPGACADGFDAEAAWGRRHGTPRGPCHGRGVRELRVRRR